MDFSTEFIGLRDRMAQSMQKGFVLSQNVDVKGRMAALYGTFGIDEERKLLGIMGTGSSTHAHEYRVLFAEPVLNEAQLEQWWDYVKTLQSELVTPDAAHEFSIISMILACADPDKSVQKKIKKLTSECSYRAPAHGWSSVRLAVVDLNARKVYTNRMGGPLKDMLTEWL